jgi:hypothetical protein
VKGAFSLEPRVEWGDLGAPAGTSWETVDAVASAVVGRPVVGVPSVRVGLGWALEYLGAARHRDHVLVPRFMGRCILSALSRHAFPVETPTPATRAVVAVDQFGLRHDVAAVAAACRREGWALLEDSPCGVAADESPASGALVRFIGLAKALPVVQGALAVSDDPDVLAFIRAQRRVDTGWSWAAWLAMLAQRRRRHAVGYSAVADLAYEAYPLGRGGNAWLRANLRRVLGAAASIGAVHARRLAMVQARLGARALLPDVARLAYVVPYLAGEAPEAARAVFRGAGFDDALYHVDVARNLLAPRWAQALLIPLNVRIADARFAALVDGLAALDAEPAGVTLLASAPTQRHLLGSEHETSRRRSE